MYERALAIREVSLGPQHPDVAGSLNNLAILSYHQGDYASARTCMQRAVAIWEASLGPRHPQVAAAQESLAVIIERMQ